ncbi:MAG: type II toxin-antitoxin system HicA family toxin [Clostridiales bacterium]|nr:type II toxin-antitoxin system HicA family toxin [Clostridiales bacterium]
MKQRDLVKKLEKAGFVFERHGSNHDIYVRGTEKEEVPRHKDVNEKLAKAILRRRGLL